VKSSSFDAAVKVLELPQLLLAPRLLHLQGQERRRCLDYAPATLGAAVAVVWEAYGGGLGFIKL